MWLIRQLFTGQVHRCHFTCIRTMVPYLAYTGIKANLSVYVFCFTVSSFGGTSQFRVLSLYCIIQHNLCYNYMQCVFGVSPCCPTSFLLFINHTYYTGIPSTFSTSTQVPPFPVSIRLMEVQCFVFRQQREKIHYVDKLKNTMFYQFYLNVSGIWPCITRTTPIYE